MAETDFDIVIIGAGIAGSALACGLRESGYRLALVEARPPQPQLQIPAEDILGFDNRVSAMTVASQKLLQELGVWERIVSLRACPYRHMTVWDADGTGAIEFDAEEVAAPLLGHIVENRIINGALLERVLDSGDIEIFAPARLESLHCEEQSVPELLLDSGQRLSTQLLVAADGALSGVRQLAGFRTREWNYGHNALVCTVECENYHQDTAWQRFLGSGPLAFLPLPSIEGRHFCSIVWSAETAMAEELAQLEDADFCERLGQAFEHRLGDVLAASPRIAFPLRQRHAVDYIKPGIALVGDAAHTIHPLAGQGINLGLQDVAALRGELLAAPQRGLGPGELALLQRYQRQRKGENLLMMAAMDGFRHLFGSQQLPLRWLRNTGMRLVSGATPIKQQLMRHAMGLQ